MGSHFFRDADIGTDTIVAGKVTRKVRAHDGSLMLVEVLFEAGAEGAAHEHPHEQASYCLAGEFDFSIGSETRRIRSGDTLYIPGGVRHGTRCVSAGRLLDCFTPQREDFL